MLKRKEWLIEWAWSLVVLCGIGFLLYQTFMWGHAKLVSAGWSSALWQSLLYWYGTGLVCAFFWPLRFYKGMAGMWRREFVPILLLGLSGPYAIILGFPL